MTTAPPARRRNGRLIGATAVTGTVTEVTWIAQHLRRIRIEGDETGRLDCVPGQHVRVHLASLRDPRTWRHARDALRTYSVWRSDGGIELCVLDHDTGGPGARWAREVKPGDSVTFGRPEGSFVLRDDTAYHLFAGEETAAVAIGAMLRAVPAATPVYGILEVAGPGDRLPLDRELTWQYRDGRPAASSASLVEAVRRLDLPAEPGTAYLAGEVRTIQQLRRHLVSERGWPRQAVRMKPFWTPGRRGMD